MDDGGEERGDQNKTESGCLDAHQGEENTKCQPRAKGPTKAAATYDGTRENFPPTNDTAPPEQQSKARTTQKNHEAKGLGCKKRRIHTPKTTTKRRRRRRRRIRRKQEQERDIWSLSSDYALAGCLGAVPKQLIVLSSPLGLP